MDQQTIDRPHPQEAGNGYAFPYTCYLHTASWLLRKSVAMMTGPPELFDKTLRVETPGLGEGHVSVSVCFHRASPIVVESDREARALILVAEGGGFILGQPSDGGHIDRMLCEKLNAIIISVDYAKSPRYPFPHALLQLYEVLRWSLTTGAAKESMGVNVDIDPSRVAIMGNSAGGNLTASLSLLLSFTRGPCAFYTEQLPKTFRQVAQILLYPSLRPNVPYLHRYETGDEKVKAASLPVWAATLMEAAYLPPCVDADQIFVTPLNATIGLLESLRLADGLCITAGLDCLKYEAEEYVVKLRKAGHSVDHHECSDALHGFSHYKKGFEQEREFCWSQVSQFLQQRFQ